MVAASAADKFAGLYAAVKEETNAGNSSDWKEEKQKKADPLQQTAGTGELCFFDFFCH